MVLLAACSAGQHSGGTPVNSGAAVASRAGATSGVAAGAGSASAPPGVATVPPVTPRTRTAPVVDSTEIARPEPVTETPSLVVNMDATRAGVQPAREVRLGDTFRVAIVAVAMPPNGLSGLNFIVNYDKTKIVAPSIAGGPATDRNPRLNVAALGGDAAGWTCLPGPEGDLDDPGGTDGDGKTATGQAFLSCYATGVQPVGGTQVVATVEFTAIATGSSDLKLSDLSMADAIGVEFAHCEGDAAPPPFVPCPAGTANVN